MVCVIVRVRVVGVRVRVVGVKVVGVKAGVKVGVVWCVLCVLRWLCVYDVCCGAFGFVFLCVYTWCFVVVWCRVWLCGVCLGACTHVVLCVVWVMRVCVCVCVVVRVCVWLCVWHGLARGKKARVLIQHASLRTVSTPPCVPATGPHVEHMRACCRYTRRRADGTHGGVLNQHTGGLCLLSLSFFSLFLLSLFLFSLLSCLSSSLHDNKHCFKELHARSIIAAVVCDDCCHLLFRHCWKCEQTANKVSLKTV